MRSVAPGRLVVVLCLLSAALVGIPVRGQSVPATDADRLRDFIHYTKIARYDAAELMGQQLLASGMSPEAFADLIESSGESLRFAEAVGLAMRAEGGGSELESTAGALQRLFERGRLNKARAPAEVERNIALLTGGLQGRFLAQQRLVAAGEYALPQLLEALLDGSNPQLQAAVQRLLIDMGRQAVMPLATALPHLQPAEQELVVQVLGQLKYGTSAPFIMELMKVTKSPAVSSACRRALDAVGGSLGSLDAASLYEWLGEVYYGERAEVTSFPGEEHQLLWSYLPGAPKTPLIATAIRTEVYHEAMAMRMAEKSLSLRGDNPDALALWVASNFKRQNETPEGYENPAYASARRGAEYYAAAAGVPVNQRVLARAIDTRNTRLAGQAIEAIERTAGGSQLWSGLGSRRPLLESLTYPNRRVQYDAALALGKAQPTETFTGSERVVPLLASAIRDASKQYALVITGEPEQYQAIRRVLEREGYVVLPRAGVLAEAAEPVAEAPGIDLIVTAQAADATLRTIDEARASTRLAATPVLALVSSVSYAELSPKFERDRTVLIRQLGLTEVMMATAARELVDAASGGLIGAEEAAEYASRALSVLRDLAVSGSPVFDVSDAAAPLIASLGASSGATKLRVAEVLSRIGQERAQVALMDTALAASGPERVALLNKVGESAKRYGNMLSDRHVTRLVGLARDGRGEEAVAAAALMGALNLPSTELLGLIGSGSSN
ncbi:MAG: hypothetical protein KIS87_05055 [Phycisphaeraceae bacterium]|nr:hypothetical protein [Phycisphaeraceae bacterium]